MSERLPRLIDCKGLQEELGVKRHVAEQIMRQLELVQIPGVRRTFVRRDDVRRLLEGRAA